jgi:hypothetical protein
MAGGVIDDAASSRCNMAGSSRATPAAHRGTRSDKVSRYGSVSHGHFPLSLSCAAILARPTGAAGAAEPLDGDEPSATGHFVKKSS